MAKISFILQSKINPAKIYIRLQDGRNLDIKTPTNLSINFEDWSTIKQKPKNLKLEAFRDIDSKLQHLRTNLLHHLNSCDDVKNLLWLKNFINPTTETVIPKDLIKYFDYYLLERKLELNTRTIQKIKVVQNKLVKMQKETRKSYLIKDINATFKNDFFKWNTKYKYAENTILNNLKEIKTVCFHAQKRGLTISTELKDIKVSQKKAISIYLNFDEIELIKEFDCKTQILKTAKDWLLISCYTGQRVSDFMRFESSMIRTQNNIKLIEFTQKKTGKIMTLPLHPEVLKVLDRNNGEFPIKMTEPKYNIEIKNISRKAGFTALIYGGKLDPAINRKVLKEYPKYELVTSHIGRRSFASNFYGKIPTPLLMSATGHTTEKSFLVYIGKSDADKALQLSQWF